MKKLALVAAISASVLGLAACTSDDSETVVETDHGNISKEEFYDQLKSTSGEAVLQTIVLEKILTDKYEVDESIVEAQVDEIRDQYGESFEMFIQSQGIADEETLKDRIRLGLLQTQALGDGIEVTDEEIEQYYERQLKEIEASHILVEDEELANDLYSQLLDGADFAELAEEHSTDPGSAVEGGELGYFSTGSMVAAFEDKAFSLEIDEIGEPVQSDFGWHIIKVTDIRDTEMEVDSLEDSRDAIRSEILEQKVNEQSQEETMEKFNRLIDEANIKVNIDEFKDLFEIMDSEDIEDIE
ncbi:foldase protein PrsA [Amphibacillus marinus]|uniref:Foldase protein PrsA n=1 Tax=Amphibacillus marinus TaxID=872970 RepID=A0A1H8RUQ3_9BACI|nr:peptidylprolyl isomerase [Amphibacillus marinus]SEO69653.1 foldase protein PrsA [Amphibacillus marinus]